MRKITTALMEISQVLHRDKCKKAGVPVSQKGLSEIEQAYRHIDDNLTSSWNGGPQGRVAEAMTTGDFPLALGEFVTRMMVPSYQRKRFDFEAFIWPDTLPNYLTADRYQKRAQLDDLEFVPDKGTPRPGSYNDAVKRSYKVHDWGKLFDFSRQALINDDLGYFSEMAGDMGSSARRTLEKFVSRMYTNAVTIARLQGLGALFSTTGRLTSDRVSTARMAFNQRVDDRGEPINAALGFIVHHQGLEDVVLTIQNSQLVPETDTNAVNVVRNFTAISDPYITGTAPNLEWYGFTDYRVNNIRPFVLARRQGMPTPMIVRQGTNTEMVSTLGPGSAANAMMGDFLTGNIVFGVRDTWGTFVDTVTEGNLFDNRGAFYSSGTTA